MSQLHFVDQSSKTTPESCATDLMEAIHPILKFIRTEMRNERESSLSVPQFRLLAFLSRHPGASLSEVAEHLGVTKATASAMTERLVQRQWVDRAEDPTERRQVMLKLTPDGSDLLEHTQNMTRLKIANLLSELSSEELTDISNTLKLLSQIFKTGQS